MACSERVPIYALCSPTHSALRDEFFLPSLPENLEPRIRECDIPQRDGGVYGSRSFLHAVRLKVDMVQDAIRAHWGDIFIVSDVDIVFFRSFDPRACLTDGLDLIAQKNGDKRHNYCAGFYVCRANSATEALMAALRDRLAAIPDVTEQRLFNELSARIGIRRAHLPTTFCNPMGREDWKDHIPDDLVLFHANWNRGIEAKQADLAYVRKRFS
ncbi:MAG: hypothetical protein JRG76_16600 [Deltaproteobacteria bacterium]|nr:hypothetical protein [Deltaproteobacteria bacterium]